MALSEAGMELKRTPLYDYYQRKGIKLSDFGSWALPIHYTSIIEEHKTVREKVGLFDVSHMGEIEVSGDRATSWLNRLITNDLTTIDKNQAIYTIVPNESGGILDDIIIFKYDDTRYLLTPNASNTQKILDWITQYQEEGITITDRSQEIGLIAVQGPYAKEVVAKVFGEEVKDIPNYAFITADAHPTYTNALISRTGYTGEDGYEVYVQRDQTEELWEAFMEAGEAYGIQPCGLGARDTLRLEAGMPLYGQDLSEDVTPLEAGLRFAVKWDKDEPFIGQEALEKQKETGVDYLSRGFELVDKGIAREGYPVVNADGEEIGQVTSGTRSPSLNKSIGFMRVQKESVSLGDTVWIQVRKKTLAAKITKKNWLKQIKKEG
ncbi:glycine cleavage system aminomethyltransferase GcvT [Alkalibacterium iburiense]|uniref:glycine cleavage system aminomethyltransferase GcvT n=1 Tax=Alkalibacterium iburiense TaxID=290589 RepID=UPI0031D276B5